MPTSTEGRRLRTALTRYLWTTVAGVAVNLTLYLVLARRVGIHEPVANLMAALLVIGPRFCVHKYVVWEHRLTERIGREVGIHGGLTVAGLILSTLVAAVLAERDAGAVLLAVGNVSAFGVTWLLRFLVSHLYLFVDTEPAETDADRQPTSPTPADGSITLAAHDERTVSTAGTPPV